MDMKTKQQILLDNFNEGLEYKQTRLPDAYTAKWIERAMDEYKGLGNWTYGFLAWITAIIIASFLIIAFLVFTEPEPKFTIQNVKDQQGFELMLDYCEMLDNFDNTRYNTIGEVFSMRDSLLRFSGENCTMKMKTIIEKSVRNTEINLNKH